jgi:trehalose 6-phosphate phosphatase
MLPSALAPLAARPQEAALLVDFDGSISKIVDDPADAVAMPEARAVLARLVGSLRAVAVVSGRPVSVLARAIDVDGITLVGQYGLERLEGGEVVVDPRAAPYLPAVAAAADEAERALPGLLIERKAGVAVTVHWRTAPERDAEATAAVADIARRHGLTVYSTRMAREIRPPVPVDKGTAVAALLDRLGVTEACFAGDDRGDVSAFDALTSAVADGRLHHAVRIAVDSPEAPPELLATADVTVDGPAGLVSLLDALADEVSGRAAPR